MSQAELRARVDRLLGDAVLTGEVPGVAGIAAIDGELVYENAFGDASDGATLANDSIFRIASMTKLVTSVAALQLVEQGLLDLDAAVADILPSFDELAVLDGFAGEAPMLRPPRRRATIRQLFTHTSGLGYDTWNALLLRHLGDAGIPPISSGLRDTFRTPLIADPGVRFEYGTSMDWLGLVIEEVSGLEYGAYLDRNVFAPLGTSDLAVALRPDQRERLVAVYDRAGDGSFHATEIDLAQDPEFYAAGHCLYSTAGDFLALQRALLDGGAVAGGRLLREETVRSMFTNQIGELHVGVIHTAIPSVSVDADFGPDRRWGLGGLLNEKPVPGGRNAWSAAWAGLFNTFFWIDPEANLAAGLYLQYLPFHDRASRELLDAFERALYQR